MFPGLYDDKRSAQATAYMLYLAGGRLEILKLMKLLYLAERKFYELHGEPLTGDVPFSMKNGPVLSSIFDRLKKTENLNDTWRTWIIGRSGHEIQLKSAWSDPCKELGALSKADLEVMDMVWLEFGHCKAQELVHYTHDHCAEWSDPGTLSRKIQPEIFFRELGMSQTDAQRQIEHLRQTAQLNQTIQSSTHRGV
ncbi:MAG: hypothetical protein RL657_1665 [Pseudomonadota bacterium]|jgi:uncharacterized phage-associated protein